jgi:hypothetical protein
MHGNLERILNGVVLQRIALLKAAIPVAHISNNNLPP